MRWLPSSHIVSGRSQKGFWILDLVILGLSSFLCLWHRTESYMIMKPALLPRRILIWGRDPTQLVVSFPSKEEMTRRCKVSVPAYFFPWIFFSYGHWKQAFELQHQNGLNIHTFESFPVCCLFAGKKCCLSLHPTSETQSKAIYSSLSHDRFNCTFILQRWTATTCTNMYKPSHMVCILLSASIVDIRMIGTTVLNKVYKERTNLLNV